MQNTQTLDVTVIEPRLKHTTIFNIFHNLQPGESFEILNDHDPKPLYYQLLAEEGNTFTWKYIESGPSQWRVELGKVPLTEDGKIKTIGEIAADDYRKALIFKKYGLDFCCGGKKTLEEAAKTKGISKEEIEKEINALDVKNISQDEDILNWELDKLVDHIVDTHHSFVKTTIPEIVQFLSKVTKVHSGTNPELLKIYEYFGAVANELSIHLHKEEMMLFPYIKELAESARGEVDSPVGAFGNVQSPIKVMEEEHESAGKLLEAIRELTNNYTLPEHACGSYKVTYGLLNDFEEDLFRHIHLENNILFPKAIKLEASLKG